MKSVLAPLGVAAAAGAVTAYVGAVDPNQAGHYPTCPFLLLTGYYCPGCGTLRAIHALAHADPLTALGLNPLMVAVLPFLLFWWGRWMARSWQGRPLRTKLAHPVILHAFTAVVILFWIARNMPFGRFLAP
ncbi:DUF2752 domain-containing protein [Streptosporangiaceae bacterium NEAU-GS5]|nr:DUF2752 domain-containing protein [Streptosporangiaceae bacterium NEAU-GS5]